MGWAPVTNKGKTTITGAIGDPLLLHVRATFDSALDFTGHTWLAQARLNVPGELVATFDLVEDLTTVTPPADGDEDDPGSAIIDLMFGLPNTTVFDDGVHYVYGVKAIEGDLAPFTLIRSAGLVGYDVVPREEP